MNEKELLQAIYNDVQTLKTDMHEVKTQIQDLDTKQGHTQAELKQLQTDFNHLQTDVHLVKDNVSLIKATLELETNRNIKIIAEGHLDLSRKLDQSILMSSEVHAQQELQNIYINFHESKLRELAQKVG